MKGRTRHRWFEPLRRVIGGFKPVDYAGWELFVMRCGFGVAICYAFLKLQTFPEAPSPVGMGLWLDVTVFHDADFNFLAGWTVIACMAAYAIGVYPSVALPIAAFLFVGTATLNTSQGKIHHDLQAGGAVLCVLALWHVIASVISRFEPHRLSRLRTYQLAAFFVLQTLAAAYMVSAVTKLERSGLSWFSDAKYAPVAIRKTEDVAYFSTLEVSEPGAIDSESGSADPGEEPAGNGGQMAARLPRAVQRFLLDHPSIAGWVLGPGLLLELFAFVALLGRRWALGMGLVTIAFHFMVGRVMNLHFQLNNHLLIIFLLNLPYWGVQLAKWGSRRFRRAGG